MSRINYSFIFMCKRKISTSYIQWYNGFKLAVKTYWVKHKMVSQAENLVMNKYLVLNNAYLQDLTSLAQGNDIEYLNSRYTNHAWNFNIWKMDFNWLIFSYFHTRTILTYGHFNVKVHMRV